MQRTLSACPKGMTGGRIARNRYEGVCRNDENIQALLDGGFYWKVLNWMQFHQNAHLKLVILQQMTCTQSFKQKSRIVLFFCYYFIHFSAFYLWSDKTTFHSVIFSWNSPKYSISISLSFCLPGWLTHSVIQLFNQTILSISQVSSPILGAESEEVLCPLLGLLSPTLPPASISLAQERYSVNCFNSLQIILWSTNLLCFNDSILRTLNEVKNKKTVDVFICRHWFRVFFFLNYQITPMVQTLALPGQLTIPLSDNWGSAEFE